MNYTATLIKQYMQGFGITEPKVLGMVDRIAAVGFKNLGVGMPKGGTLTIPEGADTAIIEGLNGRERYRVIIVCEKIS